MANGDLHNKLCKAALLKEMFGNDDIEENTSAIWVRRAPADPESSSELELDRDGYSTTLRRIGPSRGRTINIKLFNPESLIASNDALITFNFFDQAGVPIEEPYEGFPKGDGIGYYRYLTREAKQDVLTTTFNFPSNAKFVELRVRLWKKLASAAYISPVFECGPPEFSALEEGSTLAGNLLAAKAQIGQNYLYSAQNGLSVLKGTRALLTSDQLDKGFLDLAIEMLDFALEMRFSAGRAKADDQIIEQVEAFLELAGSQIKISGAIRSLTQQLQARGDVLTAHRLLQRFDPMNPHLTSVGGWARLEARDFDFRKSSGSASKIKKTDTSQLKGIYVLHNALPYHSGGYATRAHGMLTGYRNDNINLEPVLRYGYPIDRIKQAPVQQTYVRDDITYTYAPDPNFNISRLPLDEYIELSARYIEQQAREKKAQFIKAASFFTNGLPAAAAARNLGIPYIYEMRGMAWLTKGSDNDSWRRSEECALLLRGEVEAAKQADHVFAITGALKNWLVEQGVNGSKITLLPNAIAQGHFKSIPPRDFALAAKLKCEQAFVIGYVGSFVEYEGLDLLIDAFEEVREQSDVPLKLMLIGDGPYAGAIRHKIAKSSAKADIIAPGRVPHEEVSRYYSLINVAVLARKPYAVCEMISPIKPFELFAMGVPILASDVQALAEIVKDGERGKTFEAGNTQALAAALTDIIQDPDQMKGYTQNAREWVNKDRTWDAVTKSAGQDIRKLFKA